MSKTQNPKPPTRLFNFRLDERTYWKIKALPDANSKFMRKAIELYLPDAEREHKKRIETLNKAI